MKRVVLLAAALALAPGCRKPYRVGDYVWVEWDGRNYPGYIIDKKGPDRYRVHLDGYDSRWDQDVPLDRIKGMVEGPVAPPPPPEKVARAAGLTSKEAGVQAAVSPYRAGDRVRVKWRGSVYAATIIGVISSDQYLVHYDGHETAWDETVGSDRIVGKR